VATTRDSNLGNARRFADGDPYCQFGLAPLRSWSYEEVAGLMVKTVGIDPDLSRTTGADTIDVNLTVGALRRMRDRIAETAAARGPVLLATGHPTGLLEIHLALAQTLRAAGCPILAPAPGVRVTVDADRPRDMHLRYLGGVAMYSDWGGLHHSHSPAGMVAMLEALDGVRPDLVIADHGMAGAAGAAGLDVVSFADCNDPGLFVGEAEGRIAVTVPLDDNVQPHLYGPAIDFLVEPLLNPRSRGYR
jgi:hypothetical protein